MSTNVSFEFQKLYIVGNFYVYLPRLIDTEDKDTIDKIYDILFKNKDYIDEQLTYKGVLYQTLIQLLQLSPFKNTKNNSIAMSYWECVLLCIFTIIFHVKVHFFTSYVGPSTKEDILVLIVLVCTSIGFTTFIIHEKKLRKKTLEKLKKHFENGYLYI